MTNTEHKICMATCFHSGVDIAKHLIENEIRLSHIVSITPAQAERHEVSGYVDVGDFCSESGVGLYRPERYDLKCDADQGFFEEQEFDLLIVAGWNRLIPETTLKRLRIAAIGVHGSPNLLPVGRGRSPTNWALIDGCKRFIIHMFMLEPGVDDGRILATQQYDINVHDTVETLNFKFSIVVKRMMAEQIPRLLAGNIQPYEQVGQPEYYQRRTPEDGAIDWKAWDVYRIHDFVRALTRPYPGAFAFCSETIVRIWRGQVFDTSIHYPQAQFGEVVEVFGEEIVVNCRGGLLLIRESESTVAIRPGSLLTATSSEKQIDW